MSNPTSDIAAAASIAGRFLPWTYRRGPLPIVAIESDKSDMPFAVSPCTAGAVRTITILGVSPDGMIGPAEMRRIFDAINQGLTDG